MTTLSLRAAALSERAQRVAVRRESAVIARLKQEMGRIGAVRRRECGTFERLCNELRLPAKGIGGHSAAASISEQCRRAQSIGELASRARTIAEYEAAVQTLARTAVRHGARCIAAHQKAEKFALLKEAAAEDAACAREAAEESEIHDDRAGLHVAIPDGAHESFVTGVRGTTEPEDGECGFPADCALSGLEPEHTSDGEAGRWERDHSGEGLIASAATQAEAGNAGDDDVAGRRAPFLLRLIDPGTEQRLAVELTTEGGAEVEVTVCAAGTPDAVSIELRTEADCRRKLLREDRAAIARELDEAGITVSDLTISMRGKAR